MARQTSQPWVIFIFHGADGESVGARAVGQFLLDLTAAARHIAADLLGQPGPQGPLSLQERSLVEYTLVYSGPGSTLKIEIAPPRPEYALQTSLAIYGQRSSQLTPDVVMRELRDDLASGGNGRSATRRSRAIDELRASMRRIAPQAGIDCADGSRRRVVTIPLQLSLPADHEAVPVRRRVLFGRAMMADAQPDQRRLRVTMYDGSSLLLEVPNDLAVSLRDAFDRDVEVRIRTVVATGHSTVESLRLLEPAEIGVDVPDKDWQTLMQEQGLDPSNPPDYPSMLKSLFDTNDDAVAFANYLRDARGTYDVGE